MEIPELISHREELDELRQRVDGGLPQLHALTYAELFAEWDGLGPPWVADHVTQLRARYAVSI